MLDTHKFSDGKTTVSIQLYGYDTKYRESRKHGPSWRRFNTVRYSFVYNGPEGQGCVRDRHISTFDIARVYAAADSVLLGRLERVSVVCKTRDFRVSVAKKQGKYELSLQLQADSGKVCVHLTNLESWQLFECCKVFFDWKDRFPILSEQELKRVYTTRPARDANDVVLEELDLLLSSLSDPDDDNGDDYEYFA